MGITFKENCPDVRNTKVVDIIKALKEYNLNITIYDPLANPEIVIEEYGLDIINTLPANIKFDALRAAVAHKEFFRYQSFKIFLYLCMLCFDVKASLPIEGIDAIL